MLKVLACSSIGSGPGLDPSNNLVLLALNLFNSFSIMLNYMLTFQNGDKPPKLPPRDNAIYGPTSWWSKSPFDPYSQLPGLC